MPESKYPIDPKKLKPIMYWAGLTLHACQQFDYGLKLVLFMTVELGLSKLDREHAQAIIDDRRRLTSGQVLSLLSEHTSLSPGLKALLEEALRCRNRFIHGYLSDASMEIAEGGDRGKVLKEIKAIRSTILAGDQAVRQMLEVLYNQLGVSFVEILRQAEAEVREIQSRDTE